MNFKNEKTEIPCPAGGRAIRTTYGDLPYYTEDIERFLNQGIEF